MSWTDDMNMILLVFLTTRTNYPVFRIGNTACWSGSQTIHNANLSPEGKNTRSKKYYITFKIKFIYHICNRYSQSTSYVLGYSFLELEEFTVEWACQVGQEITIMQQSVMEKNGSRCKFPSLWLVTSEGRHLGIWEPVHWFLRSSPISRKSNIFLLYFDSPAVPSITLIRRLGGEYILKKWVESAKNVHIL